MTLASQKTAPMTGIDTHAHIFTPNLPMVAGRRYSPNYSATLQEWFQHQEAEGISHGVLIQPSFLGTDNHHIEEALMAAPQRLRAIAVVDHITISDSELDRLNSLGFTGIRLNLVGKDIDDFHQEAWQNLFKRLAKRNWQVEIQRSFDDLAHFVPEIAASGVDVVIDHFGLPKGGVDPQKPAHAAFLKVLSTHSKIWIKLSAPYRAGLTLETATQSMDLFAQACKGIDRFVWGSDWPNTQHETQVNYQQQMAFFKALVPDPAARQQILTKNAAALFQFN